MSKKIPLRLGGAFANGTPKGSIEGFSNALEQETCHHSGAVSGGSWDKSSNKARNLTLRSDILLGWFCPYWSR